MRRILFVALCLLLSSCTTIKDTITTRTANEELLISIAYDKAANALVTKFPQGHKVFIDAEYFEGQDSKYGIAAIKDSFLMHGDYLANNEKDADIVVLIRAGSSAINQLNDLVGIPNYSLPIPFSGGSLQTPAITFYQNAEDMSVVKLGGTGFDPKTGKLIASALVYGTAKTNNYTIMLAFTVVKSDLPKEDKFQN